MILVWDNGGSYSDHKVSFVDCGDWDAAVAERVLSAYRESSMYEGRPVAVIEDASWRDPKAVMALEDYLEPWLFSSRAGWLSEENHGALLRATPREMLEFLIERWRTQHVGAEDMFAEILAEHAGANEPEGPTP
jgi:hypothetical protein